MSGGGSGGYGEGRVEESGGYGEGGYGERGYGDVVFNALFNHGDHPIQPLPKVRFYKYCHNSGQKWIPRHDSGGIRQEI